MELQVRHILFIDPLEIEQLQSRAEDGFVFAHARLPVEPRAEKVLTRHVEEKSPCVFTLEGAGGPEPDCASDACIRSPGVAHEVAPRPTKPHVAGTLDDRQHYSRVDEVFEVLLVQRSSP